MSHHNSLFERLECAGSSRLCRVASVAAHLGKMLSTRAGSVQTLPDYGLPDLNDMRLSLHESLSRSRLLIERFIRVYEPRLANVHVRVSPRAREPLALAFAIEAEMAIDGVTRPVVFHARLDDAGRVEVGADGF
ncbi:hypothetical protein BK648_26400 [Pseudomonas poae]|uniref:IraD/Gp25-like domain-containing protein n=1 Tax=Pseudomonas poae TaxID=200451 RepID=A0A423ESI6_9PSED|nr:MULTISPECIES: type VI secretion system baseplate subunit TssE [Pseudomonas]ROM34257.1 hypothetical protein BK648_26400 [Pseudomonas poae]TFF14087.1 type VI secretion system baseplate subunit TssE [Pseudomonas sp. JMN1]TFF15230.1 type VI secretion system baseplate subunit TssE [Pseudomonas sp. BCA17]TFF31637.1 type VI secretion system baseplate subunit TssE [Pseudomonas sp. BCA14]TFF32589.1 type VI secretion system baseplate subunit TssE [Pseudomonas sp. BCA13]